MTPKNDKVSTCYGTCEYYHHDIDIIKKWQVFHFTIKNFCFQNKAINSRNKIKLPKVDLPAMKVDSKQAASFNLTSTLKIALINKENDKKCTLQRP